MHQQAAAGFGLPGAHAAVGGFLFKKNILVSNLCAFIVLHFEIPYLADIQTCYLILDVLAGLHQMTVRQSGVSRHATDFRQKNLELIST